MEFIRMKYKEKLARVRAAANVEIQNTAAFSPSKLQTRTTVMGGFEVQKPLPEMTALARSDMELKIATESLEEAKRKIYNRDCEINKLRGLLMRQETLITKMRIDMDLYQRRDMNMMQLNHADSFRVCTPKDSAALRRLVRTHDSSALSDSDCSSPSSPSPVSKENYDLRHSQTYSFGDAVDALRTRPRRLKRAVDKTISRNRKGVPPNGRAQSWRLLSNLNVSDVTYEDTNSTPQRTVDSSIVSSIQSSRRPSFRGELLSMQSMNGDDKSPSRSTPDSVRIKPEITPWDEQALLAADVQSAARFRPPPIQTSREPSRRRLDSTDRALPPTEAVPSSLLSPREPHKMRSKGRSLSLSYTGSVNFSHLSKKKDPPSMLNENASPVSAENEFVEPFTPNPFSVGAQPLPTPASVTAVLTERLKWMSQSQPLIIQKIHLPHVVSYDSLVRRAVQDAAKRPESGIFTLDADVVPETQSGATTIPSAPPQSTEVASSDPQLKVPHAQVWRYSSGDDIKVSREGTKNQQKARALIPFTGTLAKEEAQEGKKTKRHRLSEDRLSQRGLSSSISNLNSHPRSSSNVDHESSRATLLGSLHTMLSQIVQHGGNSHLANEIMKKAQNIAQSHVLPEYPNMNPSPQLGQNLTSNQQLNQSALHANTSRQSLDKSPQTSRRPSIARRSLVVTGSSLDHNAFTGSPMRRNSRPAEDNSRIDENAILKAVIGMDLPRLLEEIDAKNKEVVRKLQEEIDMYHTVNKNRDNEVYLLNEELSECKAMIRELEERLLERDQLMRTKMEIIGQKEDEVVELHQFHTKKVELLKWAADRREAKLESTAVEYRRKFETYRDHVKKELELNTIIMRRSKEGMELAQAEAKQLREKLKSKETELHYLMQIINSELRGKWLTDPATGKRIWRDAHTSRQAVSAVDALGHTTAWATYCREDDKTRLPDIHASPRGVPTVLLSPRKPNQLDISSSSDSLHLVSPRIVRGKREKSFPPSLLSQARHVTHETCASDS
eukprot:GILJ01011307.1.p1 GENE.GILJ01011307.1~~GILJ01011307.1.p1  ORF type:complete len:1051 (-),score=123.07 GILJ01011307.1:523-3549(-)